MAGGTPWYDTQLAAAVLAVVAALGGAWLGAWRTSRTATETAQANRAQAVENRELRRGLFEPSSGPTVIVPPELAEQFAQVRLDQGCRPQLQQQSAHLGQCTAAHLSQRCQALPSHHLISLPKGG